MAALAGSKIQYVGSVEYAAVPAYPTALSTPAAGTLTTNTANSPALGSERVFVCIVSGALSGTEPTLTVTKGAITADGLASWQECTGQPGVNGDITNSPVWGAVLTVIPGLIIYDPGTASLQIANQSFTSAATAPTFSATAGVKSTGQDINRWTSLGLASSFGAWAAPHKRVLNADAATWQTTVPAIVYISSDHAETQGSALALLGGAGVATAPNQYLSVSSASAPPTTVTSGAKITTTGAFSITVGGNGYYYGITFSGGTGSTAESITLQALNGIQEFENCTFSMPTSPSGLLTFGVSQINTSSKLLNCTASYATSNGTCLNFISGTTEIINLTLSGVTTAALAKLSNAYISATIRDSDLSGCTTLLNLNSAILTGYLSIQNCKLASGVAMTSGVAVGGFGNFKMDNCDSGSKNYRFYEGAFLGVTQPETTIVDTTNPSNNGTTNLSFNVATSSATSFGQPYEVPISTAQWCNLTSGSHTATIQINSNVALTNAQIWMELECLDSSGFPIGSLISTRASNALASGTAYSASTDSWGGSETHQQFMQVSFSPAMAGYIKARIYVAVPSTTIYINPLIIVA